MKEKAISSNIVWKVTGKPHSGSISQQRKSDKLAYKIKIREGKENEHFSYSNSLHDAFIRKKGGEYWKCWKAQFGSNNNFVSRQVNGLADKNYIAAKFAEHFTESCSPNCDLRNAQLKAEYEAMRSKYVGLSYSDDHAFDVELVDKIIIELKKNKAAGLDNLTAEHALAV